ncbi:DUF4157 domain-containing protein [Desulfitobacterium sp. AusDCA]
MENEHRPGLRDGLRSPREALSTETSLDDVKVHYNADKPAQLEALKYIQEADRKIVPGQGKHLPHDVHHVVRQGPGRAMPQTEIKIPAQTQEQGKKYDK